eukprot:GHVU01225152.1.p1 GENE.GHVU01225152.1~~GHVU01225152.1.p1  ORF type:complete len:189 (+),score=27.23 GHVU01225152.1:24-590(+)
MEELSVVASAAATAEGNVRVTAGPLTAAHDGKRMRPSPPGQALPRLLKGGGGSTSRAVREAETNSSQLVRGCAAASSLRAGAAPAPPPPPPAVAGAPVVYPTVDGKAASVGRKNGNVDGVLGCSNDEMRTNTNSHHASTNHNNCITGNAGVSLRYGRDEPQTERRGVLFWLLSEVAAAATVAAEGGTE